MLQLNLTQLSSELGLRFGWGLLQVFQCIDDQCLEGGKPFGGGKAVRILSEDDLSHSQYIVAREIEPFRLRRIVGWSRFLDVPDPMEQGEYGLISTYIWAAPDTSNRDRLKLSCPSLGLTWEDLPCEGVECLPASIDKDKLGGWPRWVQNVEYPSCPKCSRRMQYIFQLDSEDHIPFSFGDLGCGHVTQCPHHLDVVTFAWACS